MAITAMHPVVASSRKLMASLTPSCCAIVRLNGLFSKVLGKAADDFDKFLALEKIAEKRKELESICRLYAPIGTRDRFIEYEAKMRKQRKRDAEERQRQIAQTIRYISWGLITAISVGRLSLLYFFTEFLRGLK